jgi:DNA-binding response OmpR family regulator
VIAEDDPDVSRIVDAQLRAGGYTAITARDGEEALAAVRAHAPDLLVLDMMMPRLNGFEVLAQLRNEPGPAPRIMVLSARGREQDVVRAFDLGADDYMTKPFNPQEMMARIGRLLKGATMRAMNEALPTKQGSSRRKRRHKAAQAQGN